MKPADLKNKTIAVLGLGESGLAMLRWCLHHQAKVLAVDSRAAPPGLETVRALLPTEQIHVGQWPADLPAQVDMVAVSPGIAPTDLPLASWLQAGKPLLRELDLFFHGIEALRQEHGYQCKIICITGTNGKTTVTRLTGRLLTKSLKGLMARQDDLVMANVLQALDSPKEVAVAGNISPAMLDELLRRLSRGIAQLPKVWVLELSSFQLHGVQNFVPDVGAILNITQDHLDWHVDMAEYIADKAGMFAPTTLMVVNRDDPLVVELDRAPSVSFGLAAPQRLGDWGLVRDGDVEWIAQAQPADLAEPGPLLPSSRSALRLSRRTPQQDVAFLVKRLLPVDELQIRGRHNIANAMAALALAQVVAPAGATLAHMLNELRRYRGEPHRMQLVAEVAGVQFVDDSKGTNVGATVAALNGLDRPCVLIAGGLGKGQNFTALQAPVRQHCRTVLLIGRDALSIQTSLQQTGVPTQCCDDLPQAVARAAALAQSGDIVLLSPACASQDMFRDYRQRAEVFAAAVGKWQEESLIQHKQLNVATTRQVQHG